LHVWLAHVVYIYEVVQESQENTEILRLRSTRKVFVATQNQYW